MAKQPVRVIPEDLVDSAARVHRHSADLSELHAAADRRVEGALPFMPAAAAAALAAKAAEWQLATAAFTERLESHATALHTSATIFTETDDGNAQNIERVSDAVRSMIV